MSQFSNEIVGDVVVTNLPAVQPVSGGVNVTNFPATQPVSGPLTDTQLRAASVPVSGPLTDTQLRAVPVPTTQGSVPTATVTANTVGAASAATLLASRAARSRFVIYNEVGTLYVKLGSAATASDYSVRLTANTSWEYAGYSGIVSAIKASGSTNVQVSDI